MKAKSPAHVDEYIHGFSPEVQSRLEDIRALIKGVAPNAAETIKYDIPTYVLKSNFVHFAAFKQHIAVYPAPTTDKALGKELTPYLSGRSTLQFPLNEPLPLSLISKVVKSLADRQRESE